MSLSSLLVANFIEENNWSKYSWGFKYFHFLECVCASKWNGQETTLCLAGKAQLKSLQLVLPPKSEQSHLNCLLQMNLIPGWLSSLALDSGLKSSSWPKPHLCQRLCKRFKSRDGCITEFEPWLSYWCRQGFYGMQSFQQGQLQKNIFLFFSVLFYPSKPVQQWYESNFLQYQLSQSRFRTL